MTKRIVYIAHPLGINERNANRAKAAKWVEFAIDMGYVPIADWIIISSVIGEERRDEMLEIDKRLISLCDELWLCGPEVSPGMKIEKEAAIQFNLLIRDFTDCFRVEIRETFILARKKLGK